MKSAGPGSGTLTIEVIRQSRDGFWLALGDEELCIRYADSPWFRDAPVHKLAHVEMPSPHHLYWPELDIDLAVESVRHPEKFPLVSRG